jgi:hypothetical protein
MAPPTQPVIKTKEMQEFEAAFIAKCKTHFKDLSEGTKAACIAVINSVNNDIQLKNSVATTNTRLDTQKKEMDKMAATMAADRKIADARSFVNEWLDKWQTKATVIHIATTMASAEYDLILQTRAEKSIMPGALLNIALSFLPELKIFEAGFKRLAVAVSKPPILTAGISRIGVPDVVPAAVVPAGQKAVQLLDQKSKDILDAFRSGVSSNADITEASKNLLAAYTAKNEVFKKVLGNIVSNLIGVTNLAAVCYEYLNTTKDEDPLKEVKDLMTKNGLPHDTTKIDVNLFDLLSKQLLYDTLREYAKRYVTATSNPYLVAGQSVTMLDGLDDAQLDMIVARFDYKHWKLTVERQWINGADSMVAVWKLPSKQFTLPRAG